MKNSIKPHIIFIGISLCAPIHYLQCSNTFDAIVAKELCTMVKEVTGESISWFKPRPSFSEGTLQSSVAMAALLTAGSYVYEKQFENPSSAKTALCNGIAGTAFVLGATTALCAYHQVAPTDLAAIAPTIAKNLPFLIFGNITLLSLESSLRHGINYALR